MTIKALVIEDQQPAQMILKKYLEEIPEIELVGICTNAMEATGFLLRDRVDLIFLDINLPKVSGLDFLKTLKNPPAVIITTAYSEFALEGYELNVIDYLLKPFSLARFIQAVNKVLFPATVNDQPGKVEKEMKSIFVRVDKVLFKIDLDDVLFIQSKGDFTTITCVNDKYLVSESLKHWLGVLPLDKFMRIHKSYIVNVEKIHKIEGNEVSIATHKLPIGRSFRENLGKRTGVQ